MKLDNNFPDLVKFQSESPASDRCSRSSAAEVVFSIPPAFFAVTMTSATTKRHPVSPKIKNQESDGKVSKKHHNVSFIFARGDMGEAFVRAGQKYNIC